MFEVGFMELVLLFVIGLLILGPERLPRVAMQLGRWVGKARRTAHQLRMQMEREMTMHDIMRDQKKHQGDEASAPESGHAQPDASEDPEEEDANDSGHYDAGADTAQDAAPRSDTVETAPDATTETGEAGANEAKEERLA